MELKTVRDLAFLTPALKASGYTETELEPLLDPSCLQPSQVLGVQQRCQLDDSARARLAQLWLLHETLDRAEVEGILGATGVAYLLDEGLLRESQGRLAPEFDLYPCLGTWVFTDHRLNSQAPGKEHVYPLGFDSYTLARATPRKPVERVLDLCTGSGIHAILATSHARDCLGVDLNPRALRLSNLNAAVNGVSQQCRWIQGDLYEPLREGGKFELIVSNPPWVALPDDHSPLYRWGGETGEVLTQRIVAGLPAALAPGGTLAMFVYYPVIQNRSYVERIRSWLGGSSGWGIAVADFYEMSSREFMFQQKPPGLSTVELRQTLSDWEKLLEAHGVEAMRVGMVYIRRLPQDHPGWFQGRVVPMPEHDVSASVENWLNELTRCNHPDWPNPDWRPGLGSGVRAFWRDARSGRGKVEFVNAEWLLPEFLDEPGAQFLASLDGRKTVPEITAAWAAQKAVDLSTARDQVRSGLSLLAERLMIS